MADLVQDAGGAPGRVARRLRRHTGGHPLHVQSVLASTSPDALQESSSPLPLPSSLTYTVHAVLASLSDDARKIIDALAVLNAEASLAEVAHLAGVVNPAAAPEDAIGSGLVNRSPSEFTNPIKIVHELHRECVYTVMPTSRRRELHAQAAIMVDSETAWAHRVAASDRANPALASELEDQAIRLQRLPEVARLPRNPADVTAADSPLLLARSMFRGLSGDLEAAIEDLTTDMRRPRQTVRSLNYAYVTLPYFMYLSGDWAQSALLAEQLLAQSTADEFVMGMTPCYAISSILSSHHGHWEDANRNLQASAKWATEINSGFEWIPVMLARAVIAQARCNNPGMLPALEPIPSMPTPGPRKVWQIFWQPLLVEAPLRALRPDEATRELDELVNLAHTAPCLVPITAWARGQLAECRGHPEAALAAYREESHIPPSRT